MRIFRIIVILVTSSFFCENTYSSTQKADSLFNLKRYSESKILYDSIFYKENKYSNSMLLKMSSIEESLENLGSSNKHSEVFKRTTSRIFEMTKSA